MISCISTPLYYIPLPNYYMPNSAKYRDPLPSPAPNKEDPRSKFFALCQMGRQDNDPTTVNSSIALLQERFRQLEKVKERREGKELLKLMSSGTQMSTSSMHCPASENSLHPRMVVPHRPTLHDSLSPGLYFTSRQGDHAMRTPPSSNLGPQGASTSRNFESSDVDTSLHL